MKIFISYTLKDGEIQEGLLTAIDAFSSWENLELFIDKLHNNEPDPQLRIETEIQNSDLLMLVGSTKIFQSEWVKKEIFLARERNLPIYIARPNNIIKTIKSVYNKVYSTYPTYGLARYTHRK